MLTFAKGGAFDFVSVLISEVARGCHISKGAVLDFIDGEISGQYKAGAAGIVRLQFYLQ